MWKCTEIHVYLVWGKNYTENNYSCCMFLFIPHREKTLPFREKDQKLYVPVAEIYRPHASVRPGEGCRGLPRDGQTV